MRAMNIVRWILAAVMLLALTVLISSPAMSEEVELVDEPAPALPIDQSGGRAPKASGWNADETEYTDSTIHITVERGSVTPTYKRQELETLVVRVQITDPSQLRTAMSKDTYKGREQVEAEIMARAKNAVAAVNGDFFKYYYNVGYVVRQGEFFRDNTSGKKKYDMLVIDSAGDFHVVYAATTETIAAFEAELNAAGLTIVNTFNMGPVLVLNGEVQDMSKTTVAAQDDLQWCYAQQRVCIVQTGPLEYAIVEAYGRTDGSMGMTLQEFAAYVNEQCPNALMAYNLDGGGSTNVVVNGKRIHKTPGHREITDIIYFASAEE